MCLATIVSVQFSFFHRDGRITCTASRGPRTTHHPITHHLVGWADVVVQDVQLTTHHPFPTANHCTPHHNCQSRAFLGTS